MYLNDLNSAAHNVEKINKVLANTFGHNVNVSEMSSESLGRMLSATNAKITAIKESNSAYWEDKTYNKLSLISHSLRTYISEVAPTRNDGKKMKTKVRESAELEQAEVMLAAQELVDGLQKMVEDLAGMQVQKLMPIVDAMKEQLGFEQAEAYNASAEAALGGLLNSAKAAKGELENATLVARGEQPAQTMPTDMGIDSMDMGDTDELDMGDDFGGDDAAAGDDNQLGRELKGESALADMEKGALAEKKFLESKDKLFKMVESGTMSHDQFINVINELDSRMFGGTPDGGREGAEQFLDRFGKRKLPQSGPQVDPSSPDSPDSPTSPRSQPDEPSKPDFPDTSPRMRRQPSMKSLPRATMA